MTTLQTHGGGAQPASIDTSGKATGGAAMRVYGFDSEADAIAAGYVCEGGPAMSVALITDEQIASGAWKAEGDPSGTAVYTAPSSMPVEGGFAVPVYPVNGWGSTPAPVGPQFSAAEIGTVNASTVAVTFDQDMSASDYSAGVTIKVNSTATSITSATRQANHAIVYYVIPVLWHGLGDAVTWEYASGTGNIVAESDSTPLGNVSAQSVTNNCEYRTRRDYQADTLTLNNNDPISLWPDLSGLDQDFTAAGDTRPIYKTSGGSPTNLGVYPSVQLDGVDDFMDGGVAADLNNMDSVTWFMVTGFNSETITKMNNTSSGAGWAIYNTGTSVILQHDTGDIWTEFDNAAGAPPEAIFASISVIECPDKLTANIWTNGVALELSNASSGTLLDYTSSDHVLLGKFGDGSKVSQPQQFCAVMIMTPRPNDTNRNALQARLMARYGVTL